MTLTHRAIVTIVNALALVAVLAIPLEGQVGKGLIDPNVAADGELRALPHLTPARVKSLLEKRPFLSVLQLNAFLLGQKFTSEQAAEFYRKAFIHINLNTGTREEFVLVPGTGTRMAKEFAEYRPWKHPRRGRGIPIGHPAGDRRRTRRGSASSPSGGLSRPSPDPPR